MKATRKARHVVDKKPTMIWGIVSVKERGNTDWAIPTPIPAISGSACTVSLFFTHVASAQSSIFQAMFEVAAMDRCAAAIVDNGCYSLVKVYDDREDSIRSAKKPSAADVCPSVFM